MMSLRNLALFATLLSSRLVLGAPVQLNHSGFLLDGDDQRVDQAAQLLTFELFSTREGGESTFSAACSVDVRNGYYSVQLGSQDCGPTLDSTHLPAGEARYLGITVGAHALSPRLAILPFPNAVEATNAAHLDGIAASEYALKTDLDAAIAAVQPEGFARLDGARFTGDVSFDKPVTLAAPTAAAHGTTKAFVEAHAASHAYSKSETDALLAARDGVIADLDDDLSALDTRIKGNADAITTLNANVSSQGDTVTSLTERIEQLEARLAQESATGAMKLWFGASAPAGWVLLNGGTIGAPSSGATRANADTRDLFVYLWTTFGTSVQLRESNGNTTGRGSSAQADYDARKRLVLFDARGLVPRVAGTHSFGARTKTGPALRTTQEDALQNISGSFELTDDNTTTMRVRVASTSGVFSSTSGSRNFVNSNNVPSAVSAAYRVNFNASLVARTADETRPAAFGVNIIMKL